MEKTTNQKLISVLEEIRDYLAWINEHLSRIDHSLQKGFDTQ
jgi:hypothetical protein